MYIFYFFLVRILRDSIKEINKTISDAIDPVMEEINMSISQIAEEDLDNIASDPNPNQFIVYTLSLFIELFYGAFYRKDELKNQTFKRGRYLIDKDGNLKLRKDFYTWYEVKDLLFQCEHNVRSFKRILETEYIEKMNKNKIPFNNFSRTREKIAYLSTLIKPELLPTISPVLLPLHNWVTKILVLFKKIQEVYSIRQDLVKMEDDYQKKTKRFHELSELTSERNEKYRLAKENASKCEKKYIDLTEELKSLTSSLNRNRLFSGVMTNAKDIYEIDCGKYIGTDKSIVGDSLLVSQIFNIGVIFPDRYRREYRQRLYIFIFLYRIQYFNDNHIVISDNNDLITFYTDYSSYRLLDQSYLPHTDSYRENTGKVFDSKKLLYVIDPDYQFIGWFNRQIGEDNSIV